MSAEGLRQAQAAMAEAGVHPRAIEVFTHYYRVLESGDTGMIAEDDLEPIESLPRLADLDVDPDAARDALAGTVEVKVNGGLGTSMGLDRAKSLLEVRPGRSFLDLIATQVLALRKELGVELPLLFMNSFRTRDDTLAALRAYPDLAVDGLPLDFLQNREPKLRADDLTPVRWPADPSLEWCPPGHGDLYTALETSGTLQALLDRGYRYAFVSNSDNLGARPDPRLAGWVAATGAAYIAEACRRTPADRKGGHLARRRRDGRLVLRETGQTRPEDAAALADVGRHRFFNCNNLWLDLRQLADALDRRGGVLGLPLIRNVKTVDPTDPDSPEVVQIETAMGAAVEVFDTSRAVEVDRSRFVPVKTTNDLLVLRSDVYEVLDDGRIAMAEQRAARGRAAPYVDLDRPYKLVGDFEARFPRGVPSLVDCDRLVVRGDWSFGAGVSVVGEVEVPAPTDDRAATIPDGTVLGRG